MAGAACLVDKHGNMRQQLTRQGMDVPADLFNHSSCSQGVAEKQLRFPNDDFFQILDTL